MRRAATGMLAITLLAYFGASVHDPMVALATVRSASVNAVADRFAISSAQVDETGLTFVGLVDVLDGSTSISTMQFTITAATMHGMVMTMDCQSSFTLQSTVTDPDTAVTGAATLLLTSLSFTVSGSPQSFTPGQPPSVGYSPPSNTLTNVDMVGLHADIASVELHHFTQQVAAC